MQPPAIHKEGSTQIDRVFVSSEVEIEKVMWLSGDYSPGDHKICLVDIKFSQILGMPKYNATPPKARRLNSRLPRAQKKNITHLTWFLSKHQILQQLHRIWQHLGPMLSHAQKQKLSKLDTLCRKGMIHAECKCWKFCMGQVDFLPKVNCLYDLKKLYWLIVRKKQGHRQSSCTIHHLALKLGVKCPLSINLQEAYSQHQQASEDY